MILTKRTSQKEIIVDGNRRCVLVEYYLNRRTGIVEISEIWDGKQSVLDRVDDAEIERIRPELTDTIRDDMLMELGRSIRAICRQPLGGYQ